MAAGAAVVGFKKRTLSKKLCVKRKERVELEAYYGLHKVSTRKVVPAKTSLRNSSMSRIDKATATAVMR